MAMYKVIQDIEAEDKFLGPLTLKQFIFAGIAAVCIYLSFIFVTRGIWYLALPFLPIILVGGFLAFPWGRDQPTEVWLLAKIRFLVKPRRRIWDQAGAQELVTVTAPKSDTMQYTNIISQNQVRSRLKVLADTIDSRGWIIKNSNLNELVNPDSKFADQFTDRLVDASSLPHEVSADDIVAADDIMDVKNNPLAQHFEQLITDSSRQHREQALEHMDQVRNGAVTGSQVATSGQYDSPQALGVPPPNYWFINQPVPTNVPIEAISTGAEREADARMVGSAEQSNAEKELEKQIKSQKTFDEASKISAPVATDNLVSHTQKTVKTPARPTTTEPVSPVILKLATDNNRSVASLAKEANEVVIKLR